MPVVSNSSPLILYTKSGLLRLLHELFGEVWIPPAVHREVVLQARGRSDAEEIHATPWIVQVAAPQPLITSGLTSRLDPGEADAIALAWGHRPDMAVLLDDAAARRFAVRLGLRVLGSAGVLLEAKRYGFLGEVRPALNRLIGSGLYLSEAARVVVLSAAGEHEPA